MLPGGAFICSSTSCFAAPSCITSNQVSVRCVLSSGSQLATQITRAGVSSFFRNAPHRLGLPSDMMLPIYAQREFSKSVWDMHVAGVRGVVNLVLVFRDQQSSLAGVVVSCSELHHHDLLRLSRVGTSSLVTHQ